MRRNQTTKSKKSAAELNPVAYRKDVCQVLHTMLGLTAEDIKVAGITYVKVPPAGIKLPVESNEGFYMMPRNLHCTEALYVYLVTIRGVKGYAVEFTEQIETFYYYLEAKSLHHYLHGIGTGPEVGAWMKFREPKDLLDDWIRTQPKKYKICWTKKTAQIDIFDERYPHTESETCLQANLIDIASVNDVIKLQDDLHEELHKIQVINNQRRLRFDEIEKFISGFKPDVELHIQNQNMIVYDVCHRQYGEAKDLTTSAYSISWRGLHKVTDEEILVMKEEITKHVHYVRKAKPLVKLLQPFPLYTELLQGTNGQFYFYFCTSEGVFTTLQPLLHALHANFGGNNFGCMIAVDALTDDLESRLESVMAVVEARSASFAVSFKLIHRYDKDYVNKLAKYFDVRDEANFMQNIISLSVDKHKEVERDLIRESIARQTYHDLCDENTEKLIYAFKDVYTGDWSSDESSVSVEKCKPHLLATVACLQLPGLQVSFTERRFYIANNDLVKLIPVDFENLDLKVAVLHDKFLLIDKIICLSATPASVTNRFQAQCLRFDCEDDSKITPEVKRLWVREGNHCVVSYEVMLREDVTVAMLKACRDEFKPKKMVVESYKSSANNIYLPSSPVAKVKSFNHAAKEKVPAKPTHKTEKAKGKTVKATVVKPKLNSTTAPAKSAPVKAFSRTRVMAQPEVAGKLPALDRFYVNPDMTKINRGQADIDSYLAANIEREKIEKQKKVRIKNEHEGAIYHEMNVLICDAAFSQQLDSMTLQDRLYQKVHYYSNWLAMVRLMNALYLRAENMASDDKHFTQNDAKAKKLRALLIHEFPTPQCVQKLQDYLLCDSPSGKKFSDQANLKFFSINFIESSKKSLREAVIEVHADLIELLKHFDSNVDKINGRRQQIADHMRARLFTKESDYYYYEARAIQACMMLLGECYSSSRFAEIRAMFTPELVQFMAECKPIRNIASHEDAKTRTYDPIVLEEVLTLARKGAECLSLKLL